MIHLLKIRTKQKTFESQALASFGKLQSLNAQKTKFQNYGIVLFSINMQVLSLNYVKESYLQGPKNLNHNLKQFNKMNLCSGQ